MRPINLQSRSCIQTQRALASASNPLDDRALSVILHSITLTPASAHTQKAGGADAEVLPPDPVRPIRDKIRERAIRAGHLAAAWKQGCGRLKHSLGHRSVCRYSPWRAAARRCRNESRPIWFWARAREPPICSISRQTERDSQCGFCLTGKTSQEAMPSGETNWRFQAFRTLPTTADDQATFGLASHGLLLCAESDGRVTLSRSALGPWERFQLTHSP